MKISKAELHDITQEAELAFWEVLVKRFPQAQSGDLSIDRTIRLYIIYQAFQHPSGDRQIVVTEPLFNDWTAPPE